MIRTAAYGEAMGIPWILNHDDLLSFRYRRWTTSASGNENMLGYLTGYVPSYIRPGIRQIFRIMLKRESELLARREVYWTNKALCSSLRSLTETASLAGPDGKAGILHAAGRYDPREFGRSLIGSTDVGRLYRWADLSAEP